MAEFIFLDKSEKPDEEKIKAALGKTFNTWIEIKNTISSNHGNLIEEWKYYSKKSGWTMKLLLKKRNLLFFTPYKDFFSVTFIFGDKAVAEVNNSGLPQSIKDELANAAKYAEGRGISLEVKTKKDASDVIELINIKIKN